MGEVPQASGREWTRGKQFPCEWKVVTGKVQVAKWGGTWQIHDSWGGRGLSQHKTLQGESTSPKQNTSKQQNSMYFQLQAKFPCVRFPIELYVSGHVP